jgi:cytochrome c-type biogenesis protein CcsB
VLAQVSDTAVFSAIVVYALAMLLYAADTAARSRSRSDEHARAPEIPALVAAAPRDSAMLPVPELGSSDVPTGRARSGRLSRTAVALTLLAFALHLIGVVARGLAAGRAPWGNMYEFAVAATLAATAAYLLVLRREPVRALGVWVVGLVTLSLGLAITVLYTPAGALVPALNSYWLVVHVAAAIVAGGMFTVGAGLTVLFLVRDRSDRRRRDDEPAGGYVRQLPSAATLQSLAQAAHVFAFPIWTFAVIAGAIWAEDSWGRYWGWDPKETWAFITWVLYAAYLHAQSTAGWRGRRSAWFAVAGYLAFLFNFFGVNLWITGLHSYAGV